MAEIPARHFENGGMKFDTKFPRTEMAGISHTNSYYGVYLAGRQYRLSRGSDLAGGSMTRL